MMIYPPNKHNIIVGIGRCKWDDGCNWLSFKYMLNNIYQQKIIPWLKDNFLFVNVQLMRKTQIGLSHTLSITENKLLFTSWLDVLNQDSLHLYFHGKLSAINIPIAQSVSQKLQSYINPTSTWIFWCTNQATVNLWFFLSHIYRDGTSFALFIHLLFITAMIHLSKYHSD